MGPDRYCRGNSGTEGVRPMPDAATDRCLSRLVTLLRDRLRRARIDGDHRWMAGLLRPGSMRLPPSTGQPADRQGWRAGLGGVVAGGTSSRFVGQAPAVGYPPGRRGQGSSSQLPSYLNEFVFRFNRRRSRNRGMVFCRVLELAVAHEPVRYKDLVATPQSRTVPPSPPKANGHPPSLERPPENRPWRNSS